MRARALVADALVLAACTTTAVLFGAAVVAGGSMAPTLRRGDVVVYRRGVGASVGDLIVLGPPGRRFVHRVVGRTPDGRLVTRGDANPIPDRDPTASASVAGRVVLAVPMSGLLTRLAASVPHARLWSQSHTPAMTETAPAARAAPPGTGP